MKNVTLSIEDHVLARAQKLASERGTSVDQMIRDFLPRETGTETDDAAQARRELAEMARQATGGLGGWTRNREELYAERLSRYEHLFKDS